MLPRQLGHLQGKARAPRCYKQWLNVKNVYNELFKIGKRPGKVRRPYPHVQSVYTRSLLVL